MDCINNNIWLIEQYLRETSEESDQMYYTTRLPACQDPLLPLNISPALGNLRDNPKAIRPFCVAIWTS